MTMALLSYFENRVERIANLLGQICGFVTLAMDLVAPNPLMPDIRAFSLKESICNRRMDVAAAALLSRFVPPAV